MTGFIGFIAVPAGKPGATSGRGADDRTRVPHGQPDPRVRENQGGWVLRGVLDPGVRDGEREEGREGGRGQSFQFREKIRGEGKETGGKE